MVAVNMMFVNFAFRFLNNLFGQFPIFVCDGFAVDEKQIVDFVTIFQKSFANCDSTRSREIDRGCCSSGSIFSRASSSGDGMKARRIAETEESQK